MTNGVVGKLFKNNAHQQPFVFTPWASIICAQESKEHATSPLEESRPEGGVNFILQATQCVTHDRFQNVHDKGVQCKKCWYQGDLKLF